MISRKQKSLMAKWDEYSVMKTAEEKGIEKGVDKKSVEVVTNLLATNRFTISEIANFASVSETFVKKIQLDLKKKAK